MPRKFLNRLLPDQEAIHRRLHGKWYMRPFDLLLHEPALWHVGRRGTAQAMAMGVMICCLPIPGHMLLAVLGALYFRANMPLALAAVWVNNPLTFGPIYYFGYKLGSWLLHHRPHPFPEQLTLIWMWSEIRYIWAPLWLGCLMEGALFALIAYFSMDVAWRVSITRRWRLR